MHSHSHSSKHFPNAICSLTFGADFFLVDCADVDGLRHSPERGRVVAAEEAAVVLLREAPAVEGTRVVAEALKTVSPVTFITKLSHHLMQDIVNHFP